MINLSKLKNSSRPQQKIQRVGRGLGSGRGKTCCRGSKGDKSRRGYKNRFGQEGGQIRLYRKSPIRGFSNIRFQLPDYAVNLDLIERLFQDGDTVNEQTLREKGYAPRRMPGGLKILGNGNLKKKVVIEARSYSDSAKQKLENSGISFKVV